MIQQLLYFSLLWLRQLLLLLLLLLLWLYYFECNSYIRIFLFLSFSRQHKGCNDDNCCGEYCSSNAQHERGIVNWCLRSSRWCCRCTTSSRSIISSWIFIFPLSSPLSWHCLSSSTSLLHSFLSIVLIQWHLSRNYQNSIPLFIVNVFKQELI